MPHALSLVCQSAGNAVFVCNASQLPQQLRVMQLPGVQTCSRFRSTRSTESYRSAVERHEWTEHSGLLPRTVDGGRGAKSGKYIQLTGSCHVLPDLAYASDHCSWHVPPPGLEPPPPLYPCCDLSVWIVHVYPTNTKLDVRATISPSCNDADSRCAVYFSDWCS